MTELLSTLPGVVTLVAGEANGAPEMAWGDSFFYYDPEDSIPADRRMPFATIVVHDYPGFDTASDLDRPGVFRLNLAVGRQRFTELFGYPPADFAAHQESIDFTVLDRFIPHPLYAVQGYASVLVPGERTAAQLPELIDHTYQRAKQRHRPES